MVAEPGPKMRLPSFLRSRVVRQSTALTHKNFLIFYKSPITTILRALIFPIAVALVLCLLKHVLATIHDASGTPAGIASSPKPLKDINTALDDAPGERLVFVRNGFDDVDTAINGVLEKIGSRGHKVLNHPNELFNECPQTLDSTSDCFAAVIFTNSNATNVDYIM